MNQTIHETLKSYGYHPNSGIQDTMDYTHEHTGHKVRVSRQGDWSHSTGNGKGVESLHAHLAKVHSTQHSEVHSGPAVAPPGSPPIQFREGVVADESIQFGEYIPCPNKHKVQEGHKVKINYGEHKGKTGVVDHLAPSGHFAGVSKNGKHLGYYHESDLLHHKDNF